MQGQDPTPRTQQPTLCERLRVRERESVCECVSETRQLLHRNVQRFRGGLVVKAHRLCVSLTSKLESNNEEEEVKGLLQARRGAGSMQGRDPKPET